MTSTPLAAFLPPPSAFEDRLRRIWTLSSPVEAGHSESAGSLPDYPVVDSVFQGSPDIAGEILRPLGAVIVGVLDLVDYTFGAGSLGVPQVLQSLENVWQTTRT